MNITFTVSSTALDGSDIPDNEKAELIKEMVEADSPFFADDDNNCILDVQEEAISANSSQALMDAGIDNWAMAKRKMRRQIKEEAYGQWAERQGELEDQAAADEPVAVADVDDLPRVQVYSAEEVAAIKVAVNKPNTMTAARVSG